MHTGLASAAKVWIPTEDRLPLYTSLGDNLLTIQRDGKITQSLELRRVHCAYHGDPANINPSPYGLILGRVSMLRYAQHILQFMYNDERRTVGTKKPPH